MYLWTDRTFSSFHSWLWLRLQYVFQMWGTKSNTWTGAHHPEPPSPIKILWDKLCACLSIFRNCRAFRLARTICYTVQYYFIESATYGFYSRVAKSWNEWIKIRTKNFLCCNLFIVYITRIKQTQSISFGFFPTP